jgi:predicted nucleic acid-binding protein
VVIIDTTVWVDYLNGVSTLETTWLDREMSQQRLGLLDLMLCEVLQGLSTEESAIRVLRHLRRFEILESGGIELAAAAARNNRFLRRRGRTVRKTIDCLIATYCLVHEDTLLHHDRDFDAFEEELGLQVLHA